jgi:hypothetical protein
MGAFIAAWLLGEGIISYRAVKTTHMPPVPGALLASSGLFAMLALLAESEQARPLAITLAYAFDFAALMNLVPAVTSGTGSNAGTTAAASNTAQAGTGGNPVAGRKTVG